VVLIHPVLSPGQPFHYHLTLIVAVTVAIAAILYIETSVHISEWVDVDIDRYEYEQGDDIQVTTSNMGHSTLMLWGYTWEVYTEERKEVRLEQPTEEHTYLVPWSDHRWLLRTRDLSPGLYRVVYNGPVYLRIGLRRRFKVLDPRVTEDESILLRRRYDRWQAAPRFRISPKTRQRS
jgi:hypothetical protein